jgi:hypothetical protein
LDDVTNPPSALLGLHVTFGKHHGAGVKPGFSEWVDRDGERVRIAKMLLIDQRNIQVVDMDPRSMVERIGAGGDA